MLAKCTNPSCSYPFRYLHEGKLYRMELVPEDGRSGPKSEWFWLCNQCSSQMTLRVEGSKLVAVTEMPERRNSLSLTKMQRAPRFRSEFGSRVILKLHDMNDGPITVRIPRASESFVESWARVRQGKELQSTGDEQPPRCQQPLSVHMTVESREK